MKREVMAGTQGKYNTKNIDTILCMYDSEDLKD